MQRASIVLISLVFVITVYLLLKPASYRQLELDLTPHQETLAGAIHVAGDGVRAVLFSDYLCPACQRLNQDGRFTNYVLVHVPGHEGSPLLNALSYCLFREGVYVEVKDRLYQETAEELLPTLQERYPGIAGCLEAPATKAQLQKERELIGILGITATPTVVNY
jgi:protein-disulfide isomerase